MDTTRCSALEQRDVLTTSARMKPMKHESDRPTRLHMAGIAKSYGGVRALCGIDLKVSAGEVHALVGENGAGKSTLIKIAAGTITPDSGSIAVDGRRVSIRHPADARAARIAVVHQEAELFAHLSVAENMLFGRGFPQLVPGIIDWRKTYQQAERALDRFGENIPVRAPAGDLSVAQRMMVEIAAAIDARASILFLDEPTASLSRLESERLFREVRRLASDGMAVVYVSHRLDEVKHVCDRITVLRDGRRVVTEAAATMSIAQIVAHMVGRDLQQIYPRTSAPGQEEVLVLEHVTDRERRFRDVSLTVRRGEIVGLYGLVGAGRTQLAEALFGIRPLAGGRVLVHSRPVRLQGPRSAVLQGIAYVPEDRLLLGVFRRLSLYANAVVAVIRSWARWGFLNERETVSRVNILLDKLRVKRETPWQPVDSLSGGNQQKVVFGRWLLTDPTVLVLDEPTRGIDVGAKAQLHELMNELARMGKSLLLISSELPEIMGMSHRVLVMREGRVVAGFDPQLADETEIAAAALPLGDENAGSQLAGRAGNVWSRYRRRGSLLAAMALLALGLVYFEPQKFASIQNLQDLAAAAAIPFLMALGATLVITSGGIDVSVGSILALSAALCGLTVSAGGAVPAAVGVAVLSGAALGGLNAAIAWMGRIHTIVVTLAMLGIYRGALRVVTDEKRIQDFPPQFRALTENWWCGTRPLIWYALVTILAGTVFLRYTRSGRSLLAVGDSPSAARLIGLNQSRLQWLAFTLSGALTGLAGAFWASSYGIVDTYTAEGYELKAIAAAVLGGCAITGGTGTALGAALGALMLELIRSALVILGVSAYWEGFCVGLLILMVVVLDSKLQGTSQ